jgi:hypothetical protein
VTQNERILIATLAQTLIQTNLEFAFHRKQLGEVARTMHPGYEASVQKFAPLIADLEKAKVAVGNQAMDLSTLLQSVLTGVESLRRS